MPAARRRFGTHLSHRPAEPRPLAPADGAKETVLAKPKQNPPWTTAELILAYHTLRDVPEAEELSPDHPAVLALSRELNALDIHPAEKRADAFRDPGGVRRRLSYLRQIERGEEVTGRPLPEYRKVVERFRDDPAGLAGAAWAVREAFGG